MSLSTQPVKGARDFYPEDMRIQKYIFKTWREACERFGYEEYDAPILEPTELYLAKGNEEIIAEQTYTLTDRGDRSLTLRTEMTPTVSRMVAGRRQELGYPQRLYSIPQCWRYERMQRGRGREFYQLNADIFGESDIYADEEIIDLADNILQSFGAKRQMYAIRINSRKLTNRICDEYLGLEVTQTESLIRLVDKMLKMERAEFEGLVEGILSQEQRDKGISKKLLGILDASTVEELPEEVRQWEEAVMIGVLLERLENRNITNAVYSPSLMRGFDYYTDITFEVFDTDPENNRSMFGGGRYDGLVGMFGVEPVPSVGCAMGDITLKKFLESHNLLPKLSPATDLYVVLLNIDRKVGTKKVEELREMGLNVAVDVTGRKIDKQIKTAEKLGIQHVVFIGEKELESETFTLKNLKTGETEAHSLQRIVSIVKDYRN